MSPCIPIFHPGQEVVVLSPVPQNGACDDVHVRFSGVVIAVKPPMKDRHCTLYEVAFWQGDRRLKKFFPVWRLVLKRQISIYSLCK